MNFNARIEDVVRSLKKISIAAALAGVLFVGSSSIPLAQQTDDVNELNKRVLELYRAGRYSDAIQIAQRVLAIREKALGRDHPDVATSLTNLAELYRRQGRYADAEPLYRRSLDIREKALGRDHPDVAQSLNNLAGLYDDQGRYADAEPLFQRSLDIREKALGRDHPDVATTLNNLAGLYRNQGRYADAEPLFQRSLDIREKAFGRDHPYVATALNNLARLYGDQGRYADAEPLYRRSLAISEKVLGRDHPDVARSLNNLALLYLSQGRYADAEPLYRRSLAISEKIGRDHPDVATSLHDLALLYRNQGRYADAEPLYRRSLTIREQALGRDHPDIATSLNNLAYLYMERARYVDALPIIRRTISQHTANKSVALPVLFQSQAQNLVSASKALTDSYEIVQRASSSAAANAVSQLAARFAAGSGELAQLVRSDQDLTGEAERLDKVVVAFVSKPPAERSATAEYEIRRRIEAVKAERDRLHQIFGQRFPDYVALSKPQPVPLQETQRLLADEEALLLFDLGAKSYAWIITRTEADWTELKVSGRGLDAQVRTLRSSLTDARQRFDPELAYKIYQATFGAFADKIASKKRLSIVTNGALTSLPPQLLVTKDPTGKKLKEVDWLVRSHAITILPSVASLKALRQFAKKSIVTKSYVAFGNPLVLGPDGTDTGAWDRQQCPKDAPASAQRVAHASTQLRDISSFFRGNLADVAEVQKLAALPETTDELCAVARRLHVPESEIWLGERATERNIKGMSEQGRLASYRIVHFATHGLIAGELKGLAEPALVLTPPAEANDTDDGLLTASEVAQLKLNADWVVLSACNTAAAGPQGAEALSGLARAFFYAGARALLVSHWPVNSDAAVRLTTKAFAELQADRKIGRAEAMRRSMIDVITRGTDQENHPAYWAPFVVVGEGGG